MTPIVGHRARKLFARCLILLVGAALASGCARESQDTTGQDEKVSPRFKKLKDAQAKAGVARPK